MEYYIAHKQQKKVITRFYVSLNLVFEAEPAKFYASVC